jgi:beta-glucosidase
MVRMKGKTGQMDQNITERIAFPKGFIWGAASAAYQIEGSPLADGAGPTTWHEFSHRKGRIRDGSTGDVACDHYNRFAEDIEHMRRLGLKAYRFSPGWARIFPEQGRINQRGLDFYDRLVDGLLQSGIQPWLTIFHLEEPLWLARMGGFVKRQSVNHLVELGTVLFRRLGDRVQNWITVNEPTIHAALGYFQGDFPPGRKYALRSLFFCLHHLLLAHARLCDAWAETCGKGNIGLAHHSVWVSPADASRERDVEAAAFMDAAANRTVLDAILRGTYPERALSRLRRFFPRTLERDLPEMRRPGTFVGINYYTRASYRWSRFMPFSHAAEHFAPGLKRSAMWEVFPQGIAGTLQRLRDEYGNPPNIITENGFPLTDLPGRDPLDDPERVAYLADHLALVGKAIASGVDCRGYFHWSLMDNFEWNKGLSVRFGLLRTDFNTQQRSWKKSAFWYRDLIERNWLETENSSAATGEMQLGGI